jgi:hypothetical protein
MQVLFNSLLYITVWLAPLWRLFLLLCSLNHEIAFAELTFDFIVSRKLNPKLVLVLLAIKFVHPAIQPESGVIQESACIQARSSHRRTKF